MIDNHGEWAKIEGRQWLGTNILKSCTKTSFSKRLVINLISCFMSIRDIHRRVVTGRKNTRPVRSGR
jgi:hypothetical protein